MASSAICSIPDCINTVYARDWCKRHYDRWRRKGSPTATLQRPPNGAAQQYYREVVCTYEGNDCLIWPFHRMKNGYAVLNKPDRPYLVSRLACEEANGPPPSPSHHAAHSCGRGRDGCVTKAHVSWKTPAENAADKIVHGTHQIGEGHKSAKLTEDDVLAIRALSGKASKRSIASQFGISHSQVVRIIHRKDWRHI